MIFKYIIQEFMILIEIIGINNFIFKITGYIKIANFYTIKVIIT
jgi:hypothetical protein